MKHTTYVHVHYSQLLNQPSQRKLKYTVYTCMYVTMSYNVLVHTMPNANAFLEVYSMSILHLWNIQPTSKPDKSEEKTIINLFYSFEIPRVIAKL